MMYVYFQINVLCLVKLWFMCVLWVSIP